MSRPRLIPLLCSLSGILAAAACAFGSTDIQVVATPVSLPQQGIPASEGEIPAAAPATPVIAPTPTPFASTPGQRASVYAERVGDGLKLHYADPVSNRELSAATIDSLRVSLGGEALFFSGEDGGPVRTAADGQHIPYEVAAQSEDSIYYEFLISPDGSTLVWVDVRIEDDSPKGTIWAAWNDRDAVLPIYEEELPPATVLQLVSLSEDGAILVFDQHAATEGYSPFPARMDLWALDVGSGEVTHLPGEPGCSSSNACDAWVGDDGRYLLRTLSHASEEPVVAYDIASGQEIVRFPALPQDSEASYAVGYPILSPDRRQLVYALAEGPPQEETFRYFLADFDTGQQEPLAESGATRLRPVRWLDDTTLVLTAEPLVYDEWHLDITTGQLARVSDRLYLGQVTLP